MLTALLIVANVLIFILQEFVFGRKFVALFSLNLLFFKEGFFWQPLSSMFLHGNFAHLALNMVVLFQFGRILEALLGRVRFALLYLVGGVLCSLLCALYLLFAFEIGWQKISLVGASGAICVLMGFYAFWEKSSTKGLLVALLLMSFVPLFMGVNVAWYGHIFGFFCGYFWAFLRRKR
ncbi:rhomboid family intramembrane serine protease [Campylobacter sp.]|uniref:rhomboid family intramembrane serine protease n=1 Tax=Campylobacter sp. TaxID=205 RepID=UPI0026DCC5E7|nr:rhomboid family intramembrane serine protease [Campylobacter sp.]MDO4673923.1 rhomboid family intramembrane serine protease [Campylobacter sp.]